MKSFPSTLNKGGSKLNQPNASTSIKDSLTNSFKNAFNNAVSSATSGSFLDTEGIKYSLDQDKGGLVEKLYTDSFLSHDSIKYGNNLLNPDAKNAPSVENAFHFDTEVYNIMNHYRVKFAQDAVFDERSTDVPKDKDHAEYVTNNAIGTATPSLFNPYYGLMITGVVENIPLLDNTSQSSSIDDVGIGDCSIKELVGLSNQRASVLGNARYKYADFMYCKDLGKISNNHLITLRRFSHPVGDNIFKIGASAEYHSRYSNYSVPGDVGHLVAWFDTEDNKLEDILSYEYDASWKELNSKIDQKESQENDESEGIAGKIINSFNPSNIAGTIKGTSSNWLLGKVMQKFHFQPASAPYAHNDVALGRNYDNNKVYTPRDTIQDTHIYEGKLKFKHEFTLTFSYKLRAYDNVNPRSAMLDLLGNILRVTYRKGSFWGGANQILGTQPYPSGWQKYNDIVDKGVGAAGSLLSGLLTGQIDSLDGLLGGISSFLDALGISGWIDKAKEVGGQMVDAAKDIATKGDTSKAKALMTSTGQAAVDTAKKYEIGPQLAGMIKNKLGRPALYAFDSLLSGDNVGMWHVTIGNPKNPIVAFGNLICTNAKVTHSGPLGIDDFPTELKVTVSLTHGKSRDAVGIEKMYTKGRNGIYVSLSSPYSNIQYKDSTFDLDYNAFNKKDVNGNAVGTEYAQDAVDKMRTKSKEYKEDKDGNKTYLEWPESFTTESGGSLGTNNQMLSFMGDFQQERIRANYNEQRGL